MSSGTKLKQDDSDQLEVLALIVRAYETQNALVGRPDPIEALQFRMEQQRLTPRDLIPFIGSRSKVSEVLSRTRSLTLPMIRALNEGLGIPASVLIQESKQEKDEFEPPDWSQFPKKEMIARAWIKDNVDAVKDFFQGLSPKLQSAVLYRRSKHIRSARKVDHFALAAWIARISSIGTAEQDVPPFVADRITDKTIRELVQLSTFEDGPVRAREYLKKLGVIVAIEPNLPHTYLDGAAIVAIEDRPVIGMTLRHDRIDSFWFTLLHELAHVILHMRKGVLEFVDDLDLDARDDELENEADHFSREALIPSSEWKRSPASKLRSPEAVMHLAKALKIHPAIVAGRMRHEWKAFRLFSNLVGLREVRKHFPNNKWCD